MKAMAIHKDKETKDKVEIRAECRAEDGKKHIEKVHLKAHGTDTVKHVERKLIDRGIQRLERHPADGLPLNHDPKKGHGGKYSWEGPRGTESLDDAPPAIDDKDPNYVDDQKEGGGDEVAAELVVAEIEIPKLAEEGVARIEVHPPINLSD